MTAVPTGPRTSPDCANTAKQRAEAASIAVSAPVACGSTKRMLGRRLVFLQSTKRSDRKRPVQSIFALMEVSGMAATGSGREAEQLIFTKTVGPSGAEKALLQPARDQSPCQP